MMTKNNPQKDPSKTSSNFNLKQNLNLLVFSLIEQGIMPKEICNKLNMSKSALSYHLRQLKTSGNIKKAGYGTWEASKQVQISTIGSPTFHKVRGHGFVFKLSIPKITNWFKRKEFLKSQKNYKDFKKYERITIRGNNIWFADKSITIYLKKDKFWGSTAEESEKKAVQELESIVISIENLIGISLKINKQYHFITSRKHFGRINDTLAKRCNGTKTKIYLKLEDGVFLIDNSYNYAEAETQGNSAKEYMDKVYLKFLDDLFKYGYTAEHIHQIFDLMHGQLVMNKQFQDNFNLIMKRLNS